MFEDGKLPEPDAEDVKVNIQSKDDEENLSYEEAKEKAETEDKSYINDPIMGDRNSDEDQTDKK